ncbi:MAG: ATP--guanido phosphotransferase [Clostridia bacterium]|nr:ATP--guanido phosphotransferase [Clostridia bacterium]
MLWYEMTGRDSDVVVSSRVRLARNLEDYPFGERLNVPMAKEIIEKVKRVFEDEPSYKYVDFSLLDSVQRAAETDRHKVSAEFAAKKTPTAFVESESNQIYIMVLEEDHLRIQSIKAGFALEEAYEAARSADKLIDDKLNIAYDEKLGYLTHCPTNLGTGMRASVMLHLPALTYADGIRSLQNQLAKIGITIRGMWGEGSAADGCLYQMSNQVTLGMSEEDIISKLSGICERVVQQERSLREKLRDNDNGKLTDKIMRAYGTMLYATLIDSSELFRLYADVRLGASLGIIKALKLSSLDKMLISGMVGVIMSENKDVKTPLDRDRARADMIRCILAGGEEQ